MSFREQAVVLTTVGSVSNSWVESSHVEWEKFRTQGVCSAIDWSHRPTFIEQERTPLKTFIWQKYNKNRDNRICFFFAGGGGGSNAAASVNMESQQQLKWNDSIRTMQHENSTEDPRIRESTYQKVLRCPFSIPPTDTISNTPHNENRLAVDTKASRTTLQQLQ